MHWLSRLLVVFIVCLTAVALPAVPAQAVCVPYDIELYPSSGVPGIEVTVYGHDFHEDTLVDIYYAGTGEDDRVATVRTDDDGDFTTTFTVPESCKGPYRVLADIGYVEVDAYFTVKPGLTVSPEKGPVGTTVTVEGRGFAKNEEGIELRYYPNGSYETVKSNIRASAKGSWETSFQIPSSTRGEHKLEAEGSVSQLYEVEDATFKVTPEISTDKPSGSVGESITMTGSRFAANEKDIQILFDGEAVVTDIRADDEGNWEENFEVPEMPTGEYSVTAEGERTQDISELSFEIEPDIVLYPGEGHVGMNLTVTGRGFAANEDVVITYDDSQVATATTNDQGSFSGVSFLVPGGIHGAHQVTAGYAADNAASAIFAMESGPPDVPELISPPDGGRVGLRGKVTPTFEWSEVSDDSGVYYSLQIATSANFTASSVIVSVTDVIEASYTMTEALPYGTYYWIVQAVDGAENESVWTTAYSIRVGLLPLWGFIAAIVAIVVLLVALIRFLLKRRIYYY